MKCLTSIHNNFVFFIIIFMYYLPRITNISIEKIEKYLLNADQIIEKDTKLLNQNYKENYKKFNNFRDSKMSKYSEEELLRSGESKTSILQKMKKMFSIYLQFFLICAIISFHKWFEAMNIIKSNYVENKSSIFIDLNDPLNKNKEIGEFNEQYVFISGSTEIKVSAKDNIFNFNYNKDYTVIDRNVEYFWDNSWHKLGFIRPIEENLSDNNTKMLDIKILSEDFMQLIFSNGKMFIFPKIISSMFLGKVEIRGISLNPQQLKILSKYEQISILKEEDTLKKIFLEYQSVFNDSIQKRIEWEIQGNYIWIYPCNKENENSRNSTCILRVSFRGYPCEKISVLAKLKNKCFKTFHTPYKYKEDEMSEHTSFVNQSSNMIISPHANLDMCNLLFCFCLSGPATYNYKEEILCNGGSHIASINWIKEGEVSKIDFLHEKHNISKIRNTLIRLSLFLLLTICFYYLPDPIFYIFRFLGFEEKKITTHKREYSLILGKAIITIVFFYSKISHKIKHCLNMFIFITAIIILVFFSIREIFKTK